MKLPKIIGIIILVFLVSDLVVGEFVVLGVLVVVVVVIVVIGFAMILKMIDLDLALVL